VSPRRVVKNAVNLSEFKTIHPSLFSLYKEAQLKKEFLMDFDAIHTVKYLNWSVATLEREIRHCGFT
jgi:hypothetical protein